MDNSARAAHPAGGGADGRWDLETVRSEIARTTGRIPTNGDAFEVVAILLERIRRKPRRIGDLTAYICSSIRGDPFEWQQLLDRRGDAEEVT